MSKKFIYANQLANYIKREYFVYEDNPTPVTPLSCSSFVTGKHGHAKSTLRLKELFTGKIINTIVNTDHQFTYMTDSNCYSSNVAEIVSLNYSNSAYALNELTADLLVISEDEITELPNIAIDDSALEQLQDILKKEKLDLPDRTIVLDEKYPYLYAKVVNWTTNTGVLRKIISINSEKR